ncbi:uncharacterized protein lobo [Halyomorpha halys]|uniref:uncharacterized protein lobo n=1 Tax=Halyomorpha halys TaxID=286706 RepID=UPI0006D51861|nr:uncharacterized protein LOC106689385 [Halyomorpha halys]
MPELLATADQNFHWYEYLDNFFNFEPFSIVKEINNIHKKRRPGKRMSRRQRRKLRQLKDKMREYIHRWSSDKMNNFRTYITHLLESVFTKFGDREKLEFLTKEHEGYYKQRSFFIVYNMMKKYLRSINTNELYTGVIDRNIMKVMAGICDYVPARTCTSSESTRSETSSVCFLSKTSVSRIRPSTVSSSGHNSKRSKNTAEQVDESTLEAARVLTAALEIHKNYIKSMIDKKPKDVKTGGEKLDKFKRIMKKKVFALAKGSRKKTIQLNKKGFLESKDDITFNFMKKIQEIKSKRRALKKANKKACYNILYRYCGKRKKGEHKIEQNMKSGKEEEILEEDVEKRTKRNNMWEESRQKSLNVRKIEMTEGDRVLANIKKQEDMKKKEFLLQCREGFEELFVLPHEEIKESTVTALKSPEWLIHKPSERVYYERDSRVTKPIELPEENLLQLCKSGSNISGDVSPTNDLTEESDEEISSISKTESVYTDEYYLDDVSECFREIDDGAFVPSSTELAKSSDESELDQDNLPENEKLCLDFKFDELKDQSTFFKKIKKAQPEKIKSYIKEDEVSITSELMQDLCETSASETSDTTYYFEPPKEKIPEEKPEIIAQLINFRGMNHRKLQLYLMEKQCKASDVSSVSEYNVWNKAIFKIKQREKAYYKKMGITESYERLKTDIKHLINQMSKAKRSRPIVLDSSVKEDFLVELSEKMFEKVNIDEKNKFPIVDNNTDTKPEKDLMKIQKSLSSDQLSSLCPSGSCLKNSDSSQYSEKDSEDAINKTENMIKRLNLRESYKKECAIYQKYQEGIYKDVPYVQKCYIPKNEERKRPNTAPSDNRTQIHPPTKKGLMGITQYSTVDEIVSCMFSKHLGGSAGHEDTVKCLTKATDGTGSNIKVKTDQPVMIPYSPSTQELDSLLNKLHPEPQKDVIKPISPTIHNSGAGEKSNDAPFKQEKVHTKKQLDQIIDVESLLSRDAKSIEDDYYSVIKRKQVVKDNDFVSDDRMEFRVKITTARYTTLKSEKIWHRHHHPGFLYFFRSLLHRRIPSSLVNLKLRTTISLLKPDNELFELPHYAMIPTLLPAMTYTASERIEHRILWDRPDKFRICHNELGDKDYLSDTSGATFSNITLGVQSMSLMGGSDIHIEEEESEYINQFDPLQTKDLNWLTWSPPEYNHCLNNKTMTRIMQDLGAAPDIYDKLEILLKNKKLGYVPMKELLSNNQEKLFHYVCSQFLNKFAIKYPKRFLRLLFFAYNQHGVQKHICTFIKPTRLKIHSLGDWQGCSKFISNCFHLKPLSSSDYPPLQLNGPDKTLYFQSGNLYELALLLESMLLGAGYDAYIVSGMVTQVMVTGMMEEYSPDEKDIQAPEIGFKRKSSEQLITIETFFKGSDRDRLSERLEKQFKDDQRLLEEIYIEKLAQKGGWKDRIQDKYKNYIGKMATPQGIDLIEKLKQEIKERQMRRKSTKELEKLLKKLQEERIRFLQEKRTDTVLQEDAGTLEEECKKYLYPPDVEIKSVYVEKMKLRELKERTEERLLQQRAGEQKKQKQNEEKYFKQLFSKYQENVYLPPIFKTQKEYEEEKLKFFVEMREHIGEKIEAMDRVIEEERASVEFQDLHFIRDDMYELYFGERTKKERARKLKKSEKEKSKETIIEGEAADKKHSEIKDHRETAVRPSQQGAKTENVSILKDTEREDDEDYISEEMSEEEIFEFRPMSEQELPKKKKVNKHAIRRLRTKFEKTFPTFQGELHEIPTREPEPIVKIKAINPEIYCWILIKKNDHDIKEDCFLDIRNGLLHSTLDKQYLRIDCLWNDKNYYIPYYQRKHLKNTRMFDFKNENLWWHLLCGEPKKYQQLRRSMRDTEDPMIQKHLEIPSTWVGHMKFPKKRFDKTFKEEKVKTYRYKRVRIDMYEYGIMCDGIRKRVTEFYNMQQTRVKCIRETFEHRNDYLVYRTRFYRNEKHVNLARDTVKISEVFEPGRADNLKCFRLYQYPDGRQLIDMFFYSEFRIDFLKMFSISSTRLKMQYLKGRTDQMVKLKMSYFENTFFDKEYHRESRFNRIVVTYHQKPIYLHYLKQLGYFEDPPIRLDIDLKVGLSYYFFRDEGEKELKFAMWELHYNIVEETFISPNVHPNRVYFFGSNEERKSTLEREVMLEREHSDKIKYLNLAHITEKECHDIIKQRGDDERHVFIDVSRKSKWSPEATEKLKIEQLYLIAERVERRLNILREKNILNYFEDLAEGRKVDYVIMQLLKSIAGEEFNLKVAQLINQLFKKYQKAQKKGCPSAKVFTLVAEKFCNFIDAYRLYYNKHSQEAEEYYKRYNEAEGDESENLIRKYIYGEDFTDNISNLKNVLSLFSPKSMDLWFDQWFKKEIKKYGTRDVGEMIKSVDEILLLREPKIKPVNTSFWKAIGEYQTTVESKQETIPISDKSSVSIASDSVAKDTEIDKQEIETTDTDTDDLCESILANYIDKQHNELESERSIQEDNNEHEKSTAAKHTSYLVEEGEETNLENIFTQQIKKLVKRYGIVNIKEGLINLGMEKYLYNLQKDIGNVDCVFFGEESKREEGEEFKKELLKKRKKIKKMKTKQDSDKLQDLELSHSAGSTGSFHDKVEKALSDYPWNLKPKKLHKDLKVMVETLETELMKCNLKHYPVPQPILAELEKPESSTEQVLPGWAVTKKPNKQTRKVIPLIKKSMEGRMEKNQQKLLKNIVFKLILKDQKDTSPAELENIFKKFSEGKDAWGPGWNSYGDRLKQLLTETFHEKVLESALEDYKYQENYLGIQDYEKTRECFRKFEYTDIPFEECELPPFESFSEKKKYVGTDLSIDLSNTKKTVGYLPSLEDFFERKKKLKEYEKKRIESLSDKKELEKKKEKKVIDCEKQQKQTRMFPEMEDSYRDKPWFKEVYFEQRDK